MHHCRRRVTGFGPRSPQSPGRDLTTITTGDRAGVTLSLQVEIAGTGDLAERWREHIAWVNAHPHAPEAHEILGYLAMHLARMYHRDADRIRDQRRDHEQRSSRARARHRP